MSEFDGKSPWEKETEVFNGNFELFDLAKKYINDPTEERFEAFKRELNRSSGLSSSYVLRFLGESEIAAKKAKELIIEKYETNEKPHLEVYDPELADFVPEDGESKKSRLK